MLTEKDFQEIESAAKERALKCLSSPTSPLNGAIAEISVRAAIIALQEYENHKKAD